jgi:uncharacterized delta-60 repeat protein
MRKPALIALAALALAAPVGADAATAPVTAGPQGLDARFGTCGVVRPKTDLRYGGAASRLARTPDGAIVAAGKGSSGARSSNTISPDTFVLTRFSPAGGVDPGFGTNGIVKTLIDRGKSAEDVALTGLAVQPDGKIVVSGHIRVDVFNTATHYESVLARYNADGSLDPTFGSGGIVADALPGPNGGRIEDVALAPDGGIIAAGSRNLATQDQDPLGEQDRLTVARFRADGSTDTAFGNGGATAVDSGFGGSGAARLKILPDGRILAGGHASKQFALVRLTAAGTLDPTFGDGGATYASPPASAFVTTLATLPDGRIVVAGGGSNVNGQQVALGRFTPDGQVDPSFGSGGFVLDDNFYPPSALAIGQDGQLTMADGGGLARYGADGVSDEGFGVSGLLNGFASYGITAGDLLLESDGTVLVAEGYNDQFAIARFAADQPALTDTASQSRVCSARVTTKSIKAVTRKQSGARYGALEVALQMRQPGAVKLKAVATVGARTFTVGSKTVTSGWFGTYLATVPVTKKANRLLKKARRAKIVVTYSAGNGTPVATASRVVTR